MPKPTPSRVKTESKATPKRDTPSQSQRPSSTFEKAMSELRYSHGEFAPVSGRWILGALATLLAVGLLCTWGALCLLFWQGSWQLLYHPKAEITRTPAAAGLHFEVVKFAATETGTNRLTGWWIPSENARFTLLFFHGADGNLSNSVDALAAFHAQGLNVFAIDYRGYGLSRSAQPSENRPSEKQLRQDAEWALSWLTVTRQIPAKTVIASGTALGADLAAELAANHAELAGVLLDAPLQNATEAVFGDSRSRLLPVHWLVQDRYDLNSAASSLDVPSLWLLAKQPTAKVTPAAYDLAKKQKSAAWLTPPGTADPHFAETLKRWLDDL